MRKATYLTEGIALVVIAAALIIVSLLREESAAILLVPATPLALLGALGIGVFLEAHLPKRKKGSAPSRRDKA